MMNETGNYPGQPWMWLYTFWYQVPPFSTSENADALVWGLMMVLTLALMFVPFIPGLRDPALDSRSPTHLARLLPDPPTGLARRSFGLGGTAAKGEALRAERSASSSACRTGFPPLSSVGTGTVMCPSTLQGYGEAAGFGELEVLPIGDFGFWRF